MTHQTDHGRIYTLASAQPGEECSPLRRRLGLARAHDRHAEHVGVELHQEIVARGVPVDP